MCICAGVLCCVHMSADVPGGQKRKVDPQGLVSHLVWVLGTKFWSHARANVLHL